MSGVNISYKNSVIGNLSTDGTKTIKTSGKYCEDDIVVQYEKPIASELANGTKGITTNGTHDVTGYKNAEVNVPIPSGYIKPSGSKTITKNGTHDVTSFQNAIVEVQSSESLFNMPLPQYCCYVATGQAVNSASANIGMTLQGAYAMTTNASTRNNWVLGLSFLDAIYSTDRQLCVVNTSNVPVSSGSSNHGRYQYYDTSNPPRLQNGTLGINRLYFVTGASNKANIVIFYCDKEKYNANPSAYPQKVDITQMCSIDAGTLTNI